LGVWNAGDDPDFIAPRGWLLGKSFCRDFLSGLTGAGAVGKTALRYVQYISLAIGRSLTGEYVHCRARVLIICLEDNRTEMQRRIRAACLYHKIDRSELDGWLFYWNPKGSKLLEIDRHGGATKGKMVGEVRAIIQTKKIDIVGLDPFIKAHDADENDNKAMDAVATLLTEIGSEFYCSMDYLHHHDATGICL